MKTTRRIMKPAWLALGVALIALGAVAYTAVQQPAHKDEAGAGHVAAAPAAHDEHAGHADEAKSAAKAEAGHDAHAHEGEGEGEGEAHLDEVTLTGEAIAQNGIKVAPASQSELSETLAVPARVSYNTEAMAHVGTPVQGRVAEIKARLGEQVKAGDTLLVIDSPALGEAQSDYLQKRTQTEAARAMMEVARTAAERARRLYAGKGISLGESQRREGDYQAALGTLRSAEAAQSAAENKLRLWGMSKGEVAQLVKSGEVNPRYSVHAPLSGAVVQREATLGEVVGPEREALLVLADLKTLWVLADVPESALQRLAPGAAARISVDALPGQSFSGKVTYLSPEMDRNTRTVQARIEIENKNLPLKAGMFAQAALALGGERQTALAVPEAAVQDFEGGPTVFVADAATPGKFAARPIKVGLSAGGMVPVLTGLEAGTPIAVEGAFVIKAELAKGIMEGKTCSGHDH